MIKLRKFYELVSRNAHITLAAADLSKVFFEGSIKDIPDRFDDAQVTDFCISDSGDFLFKIEQ